MRASDVCRVRDGCVEVDVSVSPRSNRSGPEVAELFREITGCRSEVTAGQTSRQKTVTVHGDPGAIMASLEAAVDG